MSRHGSPKQHKNTVICKAQPTTSKPTGSGRLKGKARKEAKKAAAGGVLPTTNAADVRCTITTQEFTDMAEWITKQSPPVKIPQIIITLLRSAISLRKRCSDWFRSKAGHEAAKNMTHSHFIQVLEKVQLILQRNSSPESVESPSTTTPTQMWSPPCRAPTTSRK